MGRFDDMVAADAAIFVDVDASPEVEALPFRPRGQDPINLPMQIFREPPQNLGNGQVAGRMLKVFLLRHATKGRLTINVGGDSIQIPFNKGGSPEWKSVAEIESEDAGGFMLILE